MFEYSLAEDVEVPDVQVPDIQVPAPTGHRSDSTRILHARNTCAAAGHRWPQGWYAHGDVLPSHRPVPRRHQGGA